jgi:hypothetical protein
MAGINTLPFMLLSWWVTPWRLTIGSIFLQYQATHAFIIISQTKIFNKWHTLYMFGQM